MAFLQRSSIRSIRSTCLCTPSASLASRKHSLPHSTYRTFSWWWKRGAYDWTSNLDESFQRHILRKQRILRYKYSKALRRRQLWDRDPSDNTLRQSWGWHIPGLSGTSDAQRLSSNASPPGCAPKRAQTSEEPLDSFAHFKAWIDKDPFGAVFGHRLVRDRNPPDSPWSSSSWVINSKPCEGRRSPQESAVSNIPPTSKPQDTLLSNMRSTSRSPGGSFNSNENQKASTPKSPVTAVDSAGQTGEYEFDPISMRKILKCKPAKETSSKPLFDPLFAEKGVDIPVKPYKPHRVFGYSAKAGSDKSTSKTPSADVKPVKSAAESSRLAELRKLKAATLGNNIETTAEYHGKWVPKTEKAEQELDQESVAESDEAPLFSGTTYEGRVKDILKGTKNSKQGWLEREGFGTKQVSSMNAGDKIESSEVDFGFAQVAAKLQPSLDRLNSCQQTPNKLEPSLDRLKSSNKKAITFESSSKLLQSKYEAQEASEDLDLLRPSDVRASVRPGRLSKQSGEKGKNERRQRLENDFKSRQQDDDGLSIVFPNTIVHSSKKLSESLNNLWRRVRSQPRAWLAEKVQSLENKQDPLIQYDDMPVGQKKQEEVIAAARTSPNVQNPLVKSIQTFTPSQEVLDAEEESKARTLTLRNATLKARELEAQMREKEMALAQELKATYEHVYGPITIQHRQVRAGIDPLEQDMKEANVRAVRNMMVRCKGALGEGKRTIHEVTEKIKCVQARMKSSNASLPPASEMSSGLPSAESTSKGNATADACAENCSAEPKQTVSLSPQSSPHTHLLLYKVLAYDSSTLQMTIAETTSSMAATGDAESQPPHPTEVLSRLNNVAKFLPYFADIEKQGYEIVSGSGDVLVFKKVRSPSETADAASKKASNAITEELTKTSTSPVPQPQHPTPAESVVESIAPNASASKVRRQEVVFSGSGQTWHQEDGSSGSGSSKGGSEPGWLRRTVKRVFLAGTLTAAMAYTIGVVAEQAGAQVKGSGPRRRSRPGIYSTEDSR
jgi:hypothetical protein